MDESQVTYATIGNLSNSTVDLQIWHGGTISHQCSIPHEKVRGVELLQGETLKITFEDTLLYKATMDSSMKYLQIQIHNVTIDQLSCTVTNVQLDPVDTLAEAASSDSGWFNLKTGLLAAAGVIAVSMIMK